MALLTDTDADTDTATVNRVEVFEFRCGLLELSFPHHVLSGRAPQQCSTLSAVSNHKIMLISITKMGHMKNSQWI